MTSPSLKFREDFGSILKSALLSVKPETLLNRHLKLIGDSLIVSGEEISLKGFNNIFMIAIGKGAPALSTEFTDIMGDRIREGVVISGDQYETGFQQVISIKGDHPVPGNHSLRSGENLKQFAGRINENDLVIVLLTGGSSSMAVSPPEGIQIGDISAINHLLIRSGASIDEINTVRKHLSAIKGGNLARLIHPAQIITLIISDVIGSDPASIGSGPFYGDHTTFSDSLKIIRKYKLEAEAGPAIIDHLQNGEAGQLRETPSPDDPMFKDNKTYIIGENRDALNGAAKRGKELGYRTEILTDIESGDVREAAENYGKLIKLRVKDKGEKGQLLLFGGEFTVTVTGEGRGGRVQEFLLSLLSELKNESFPFLIAGAGTDGKDGNSDAAGAWIDNETAAKLGDLRDQIINRYLTENNSNAFFKKTGQLIHTGTTGTNVMDIFMIFLN